MNPISLTEFTLKFDSLKDQIRDAFAAYGITLTDRECVIYATYQAEMFARILYQHAQATGDTAVVKMVYAAHMEATELSKNALIRRRSGVGWPPPAPGSQPTVPTAPTEPPKSAAGGYGVYL